MTAAGPSRRRSKPAPSWWRDAARGIARGEPVVALARRLGRSRNAVHLAMVDPRWPSLLAGAEKAARDEARSRLALEAPAAVEALAAVTRDASATPADRLGAARAILAAAAPPSDAMRERVTRERDRLWLDAVRLEGPAVLGRVRARLEAGVDLADLDDDALAAMDPEAARLLGREVRS